ncbi:hypothetical protein [Sphingomonas sp. MMS24-J13]|uniref:hypothetical protein n=1 Tax=Sphingomonas sp. MMS24-J13 TaxID=3238686 RepID=UPI00384B5461
MASVIGALVPAATATIAGGGLPAIGGQVADFVREFAQSSFNDLKANLAKAAAPAAAQAA